MVFGKEEKFGLHKFGLAGSPARIYGGEGEMAKAPKALVGLEHSIGARSQSLREANSLCVTRTEHPVLASNQMME